MSNEIEKRNEAFLIYQDENGIARVNVRFEGEDVWLTVEQIMELFDASQQDISYHINQIYAENEQDPERTHKKFLLVRQEGNRSVRRNMSHYNLDMIIAVGYRVKSQVATRFRQWATQHLREFIQKGFTLDEKEPLLPEYMMLVFKNPEMDRLGWFYSDSSVRSNLDWNRFLDIEIPYVPLDVQRAIVNIYKCANEAKQIAAEADRLSREVCPALLQHVIHN